MPNSILTEIKEMIGIVESDTAFDLDVRILINSAFSTLHDIGVGPVDGFAIEGSDEEWDEFVEEGPMLDKVKTYVYMKTKYSFDPPGTGFHTTAMAELIKEHEVRISYAREDTEWVSPTLPSPVVVVDIWGDPIVPLI